MIAGQEILKTPFVEKVGIQVPVVLAGMGGVSWPELVAAVSNAGGLGVYGAAGLSPKQIREHCRQIKDLTDKPWALDLLVPVPGIFDEQLAVMFDEAPPIFLSALGVPEGVVPRAHDQGMLVGSMVGAVRHAEKVLAADVDFVVAQGTDAGGHTGNIGTMSLVPQVVKACGDVPVLAAGGMGSGSALVAAMALGAQAAVMGTRFIASKEAHALDTWKNKIVEAQATDTILTKCYTGKQLRALNNPYAQSWVGRESEIQPFPAQAAYSMQQGVMDFYGVTEDSERGCLPTGQVCGMIDEIKSAAEIIDDVIAEALEVLGRLPRP